MAKSKGLRPKQMKVVEDLAGGRMSQQEILDKHRVSRKVFRRWLEDASFQAELQKRIDWLRRRSELMVAGYRETAAARLVNLVSGSKNEETARKACLDILNSGGQKAEAPAEPEQEKSSKKELTQAQASKILEVLAKEENEKK